MAKLGEKTKFVIIGISLFILSIVLIILGTQLSKIERETVGVSQKIFEEVEDIEETEKIEETEDVDTNTELNEIDNIEVIDSENTWKIEEKQIKENKTNNTHTVKMPYYIKINIQENVVNIYTLDNNGDYTVPYKSMLCSTGRATPAAGNIYTMSDRGAWGYMVGNVWAQYYTRITGAILFHSVPYTKRDKSCLEYWEYDKLGTKASAGCIRLTVANAKWIYENCRAGTKVEFYSDSNPGPFGKPSEKLISSEESVRGWDPTDPDSRNPWINYTKQEPVNEQKNNNQNDMSNNEVNELKNKENITENTVNIVNDQEENTEISNETPENKIENNIIDNNITENNITENNITDNNITDTNNAVDINQINETNE